METSSLDHLPAADETCEKHGPYVSRLYVRFWSKCPRCTAEKDEAERIELEARQKAAKEAARQSRMAAMRKESGLLGRQLESTFDSYQASRPDQGEVLAACRTFVEGFRFEKVEHTVYGAQREHKQLRTPATSLWLIGPPGTGKSHLGAAMVNHLIATLMVEARMHSAREIVRLLRSTWNKENPPRSAAFETESGDYVEPQPISEEQMINDLGSAPLLVLDEVGVNFGSDAEHVQLFDVLDLRYRLQLPTVLLSNLKPAELKAALGDRVFDRLREGATVKACTWPSHRGEFSRRAESA